MGRYRVTVRTRLRSFAAVVGIVNPDDQAQVLHAAASVVGARGLQAGDRVIVQPEKGGRPVVAEVVV